MALKVVINAALTTHEQVLVSILIGNISEEYIPYNFCNYSHISDPAADEQ